MSYNIDSWRQIGGDPLRISEKNARMLESELGGERPSGWFLDDVEFGDDGYAAVSGSLVYSEGSGWFYNDHIKEMAQYLEGEADFVITWEGGDCISGLRIACGKAIEMDVAFSLVECAE